MDDKKSKILAIQFLAKLDKFVDQFSGIENQGAEAVEVFFDLHPDARELDRIVKTSGLVSISDLKRVGYDRKTAIAIEFLKFLEARKT